MDKKKTGVFIDTNIFVIDLRYKDDDNFNQNRIFLDFVAEKERGLTSIINLFELCGILSFNLNSQQINELFHYFPLRYKVKIEPSGNINSLIQPIAVKDIMEIIYKRASFGDALIANIVNNLQNKISFFVSWDAAHFKNIVKVKTMTPKEFLSL